MTTITVIVTLLVVLLTGRASQYSPGVMQRVVAYRQSIGQLPEDVSMYDGFIAVRECGDIGNAYLIRPTGTEDWSLVLAADCASKNDSQSESDPRSGYQWMVDGNFHAEIGHEMALRWNCVGRIIDIEMIGVDVAVITEDAQLP